MSDKFEVDMMEFQISRLSIDACITVLGEDPRIIVYGLPKDVTVEQAESMVVGYLQGYEQGKREMRQASDKSYKEDFRRRYYVAKRT